MTAFFQILAVLFVAVLVLIVWFLVGFFDDDQPAEDHEQIPGGFL